MRYSRLARNQGAISHNNIIRFRGFAFLLPHPENRRLQILNESTQYECQAQVRMVLAR